MLSTPTFDSRILKTAPWNGEQSIWFVRAFVPAMEGLFYEEVDAYCSFYDHVVLRTDPGGALNAAGPGLGHAGTAAEQAISISHFQIRQRKSFALIRKYCVDPTVRSRIDAEANQDGPASWAIVLTLGTPRNDYLAMANQDTEWDSVSLVYFGNDERTLDRLLAFLKQLNHERSATQRKSNIQIWQKYLMCITFPADLASKAKDELQTPSIRHAATHATLANQPNVEAINAWFSNRWANEIISGNIPRRAARPPPARGADGNRVNAMMADDGLPSDGQLFNFGSGSGAGGTAVIDPGDGSVLLTAAQNNLVRIDHPSAAPLPAMLANFDVQIFGGHLVVYYGGQRYTICFNCKGIGHMRKDCPSPPNLRITVQQAIDVLKKSLGKAIDDSSGAGPAPADAAQTNRRRVRFFKSKRSSPASTATPESSFYVDGDGNVFDSETGEALGSFVSNVVPGITDSADAPCKPTLEQPSSMHAVTDTKPVLSAGTIDTSSPPVPPPADLLLDDDFESGFVSSSNFSASLQDAADVPPSLAWQTAKKVAAAGVALSVIGLAACATARHARLPLRSLFTLALIGSSAAISLDRSSTVQCFDSATTVNSYVDFMKSSRALTARNDAAIDSGATTHISGKANRFPKKYVESYAPNVKIEVASGVLLPARLRGGLLVRGYYRANMGSTKKNRGDLLLTGALLVPEVPVTLLSPKAMFHNEGIRTYFNDDLFLRLPTGEIFDFVETDRLYILPLRPDDDVIAIDDSGSPSSAKFMSFSASVSAETIQRRLMQFSLDKILRSQNLVTGIDFDTLRSGAKDLNNDRGPTRKHDARELQAAKFTRFGQCIFSDTIQFEVSIPFGFKYIITFLDAATRFLFIYFLRTHEHEEVRKAFTLFMADAMPYLSKGYVELWYHDNGSEFNVSWGVGKDKPGFFANNTDVWLAEYFTRRRFIVPWNPQQNPAESANRMLLDPIRSTFAFSNASSRLWPFAANQTAIVHNSLASSSKTAQHVFSGMGQNVSQVFGSTVSAANRFIRPLTSKSDATLLSPYFMLRGKPRDIGRLRVMFCHAEVLVRNKTDIASLPKAEPRYTPATHLGIDPRRAGYFMYLHEYERFTTVAYEDCHFQESRFPVITSMTGTMHFDGVTNKLPSLLEQNAIRNASDRALDSLQPVMIDSHARTDAVNPPLQLLPPPTQQAPPVLQPPGPTGVQPPGPTGVQPPNQPPPPPPAPPADRPSGNTRSRRPNLVSGMIQSVLVAGIATSPMHGFIVRQNSSVRF